MLTVVMIVMMMLVVMMMVMLSEDDDATTALHAVLTELVDVVEVGLVGGGGPHAAVADLEVVVEHRASLPPATTDRHPNRVSPPQPDGTITSES
jgi:hypothetical protein